jgi:hypothetical protein
MRTDIELPASGGFKPGGGFKPSNLLHQIWFIPLITVVAFYLLYLLGWEGVLPRQFVNNIFNYVKALFPF